MARHPSPELFYAIGAEAGSRMAEFSPQNLGVTCWSFAALLHPAGTMLARSALDSAAVWSMDSDAQSLVNALHSAAVLGCLEPRDLKAAAPRLLSLHYAMELHPEAYRSLFQCALAVRPEDGSGPGRQQQQRLLLPTEVLVEAHRHWLEANQFARESLLHCDVAATLEELFPCQQEGRTPDGLFCVDVMVEAQGCQVAVEVDGPANFSSTLPRQLLGAAALRRRLLKARSAVVSVPFFEWEALRGPDERKAYLAAKLQPWAAPAMVDMLPTDLLSDLY